MSNNINYPSNFYINNNSDNSNEKYLYENNQLDNQDYSPNKDKDFQAYTTVSLNQQPPPQGQLPPPQHLPNISNMLNYEPDIRDDNDNIKKPKLRKTFYKLPSNVSYRMKNKNYVGNCPNMNSNGNNGNMNVLSNQLSEDYNLIIRQQPAYARCSNFNDKERRPIDPPPIIQLIFGNEYMDDSNANSKTLLHTPFFFMSANLVYPSDVNKPDDPQDNPKSLEIVENNGKFIKATNGLTVASLTRMKDFDSTYGAFFIFHDMSVCVEGTYRLKFSLYEISGNGKRLYFRKSILSDNFKVLSAREFPGMRESSPLVKLFAEQGLKIRIRKDKSLSKHPSKRIFVDLPGYDCCEKKKTTYIYVGKFPRYGFKETERNNSKNELIFENETKKVMNHNHDDYMNDPNFHNNPDNMYNKYMNKQDNYYGDNDYYNRDMRGPMVDKGYRDIEGNKMNNPMIENRNKMNMKNYINNDEMGLSRYDNGNNYRMPPPRGRNMNDRDGNKNDMSYYEENQYSYYPENKMRIRGSNHYIHNSPFDNERRNDYIDKSNDYPNVLPHQNPPLDPYMNDYNHKKIYDERRDGYRFNPKGDREDNNESIGPPNIDRNDYYQRMPSMRNGKEDDYGRYRQIKMEGKSHGFYNSKPEGNNPYNYPEGSMNNEFSRKRKYNSLEDNYMMNDGPLFNSNEPRKSSFDNGYDDMNRMMPREKGNNEFVNQKLYYNNKEDESKPYIQRYPYYNGKRGNDMNKEYDNFRGENYYNNNNYSKSRPEGMFKKEGMEAGRPDGYNMVPPNEKVPYMNNEYPYRNDEPPYGNPFNDNRNNNNGNNRNDMKYTDRKNDIYERGYKREYNDIDGPNSYNPNEYPDGRFNPSQNINRYEPNRNNNIDRDRESFYPAHGNNNEKKYYPNDNKNYYLGGNNNNNNNSNNNNPDMYLPSPSFLPMLNKNNNNEQQGRNENVNRNKDASFKPVERDDYNYNQKPDNSYPISNYDQKNEPYPPPPPPFISVNDNRKEDIQDKNDIYRPMPNISNNNIKDINDNNASSSLNNDFSNSHNKIHIRNVINE